MFGYRPPEVRSPAGIAFRDVQDGPGVLLAPFALDDIASIELDLSDAVVYTASTELLTDAEIEWALGMLPWRLLDRRARR